MSKRYIEFDSAFRNRNQYPNQYDFVMEIAQTGNSINSFYSKDPVSDSAPVVVWNSSFEENKQSATLPVTGVSTTISDPNIVYITGGKGTFRTITNYYVGSVFSATDAINVYYTGRITAYKLLSSAIAGDTAVIALSTPLPTNFPNGGITSGAITIATNATNDAGTIVPLVFVPNGASIDNFYINNWITFYDSTTADPVGTTETIQINTYAGTTQLAALSKQTSNNWYNNGNFVLRKTPPQTLGNVLYPTSLPNNTNIIGLSPTASSQSGIYTGSFIRIVTPFPTSSGYSTTTSPAGTQVRINNYIAGAGVLTDAILIGTSSFILTPSNIDFTGCAITIDYAGTLETKLIATYNTTTGAGTISGVWASGHAIGKTWNINTVFLASNITLGALSAPQNNNIYEIELFARDNWVPFSYFGSLVSVQQPICYDVELVSLIIPNQQVISGRGGRFVSYPFLYVELEPIESGTNRGLIYSNNPTSLKASFMCSVSDTTQSQYSSFIKLNGDGMTQSMKFKPDCSFRLTIRLPGGDIVQTSADTVSPTPPNPLNQIDARFSFKRNA